MINFSKCKKKIINKGWFSHCEDIDQENHGVFYTEK